MKSLVFTNDNCRGCNRCIGVCSALGACISTEKDGRKHIEMFTLAGIDFFHKVFKTPSTLAYAEKQSPERTERKQAVRN